MRRDDGHGELHFDRGGYGEDPGFELWLNAFVQPERGPCKHAGSKQKEKLTYGTEEGYRLPRLIVARTQGGNDVTGTCADCVVEALADASSVPLYVLDADTLIRLCEDFTAEVFKKAGKSLPPTPAPRCSKCCGYL